MIMQHTQILQKLKSHLQIAIELEHSTLPPYLFAYWSICGISAHAKKASALILSVVREEMLHMGIVCNILNAIGGKPVISGNSFVPCFPCFLPGHSHTVNPFTVHLMACNLHAVYTFMQIELPERIITEKPPQKRWATIGQFYEEIIAMINHPLLRDEDFKHGRQIDNHANPAKGILYTVENRADAITAINEIIDQGEGHAAKSHYDADHELTHYWKFSEIHQLISSGKWNVENDVYPVAADPDEIYFNEESKQLNHQFNLTYSQLLDALDSAYNAAEKITDSIQYMMKLEPLAKKMMQIPLIGKAGNAGPTFKYIEKEDRGKD